MYVLTKNNYKVIKRGLNKWPFNFLIQTYHTKYIKTQNTGNACKCGVYSQTTLECFLTVRL